MSKVVPLFKKEAPVITMIAVTTVYEDENMALMRLDIGKTPCYITVPYKKGVEIENGG